MPNLKKILRKIGGVLIPPLAYLLMRIIWWTTSKKFHFITPIGEEQHVCVCWHGELFMSPQAYRHIHKKHKASAIISQHFDGSLIAATLNLLGIRPLRGSSRKGAHQVLLQAFKSIKKGEEVLITPDGPRGPRHHMSDGAIGIALKSKLPIFVMSFTAESFWQVSDEVLITPDGPRGPRHHMSDGAIGIALKSKLPIFVMSFTAESFWQVKSWDKFVIPKPFAKVDFYIQSISLEGMELDVAKEYLLNKMLEHTIM